MNKIHQKYNKLVVSIAFIFFIMNVISIFHAYKFTHFEEANFTKRTPSARKLNGIQKFSTLIFGVSNPKPYSLKKPPSKFQISKLKSIVEIEIWSTEVENSKGCVLLFHGYSSEKSSLMENAAFFNRIGYSTILVDFMGCGNSEGVQTTIGYLEAQNVKTVYDFVKKWNQNIIVYDNSMGAVSIMRAVSELKINPNKIIIGCPFARMTQTVENRFENMGVPAVPMAYLLTFWGELLMVFGLLIIIPKSMQRTSKYQFY